MAISRQWWSIAAAVVIAAALAWVALTFLHPSRTPAHTAIVDRAQTSPLNQPGGSPASPDGYEVYSALYQTPADEPLVFSEDSVTDIPQVNGSCLKPSTPEERQLTNAFEAANRQSHRWENKFTIQQGYRLISRLQASELQSCLATHGQDTARCQPFKDVRHVRFLGVPGFDREHTHALVSIVRMCGRYCGNGGIFEVEKAGGTWRRSEPSDFTRECSWMY